MKKISCDKYGYIQGNFLKLNAYSYTKIITKNDSDGKESACNAGNPGSIPGLGRSPGKGNGRSPGKGNGNHSSILTWRTPRTEEPGRLQSPGSQGAGRD